MRISLSDRLHYITPLLQLATLVVCLWIGVALERQYDLTQILIQQEHAVSTAFIDIDEMSHTVNTPYRQDGLAHAHKQDLWDAFHEFPPLNPPSWYDPDQRP